MIYHFIYTCRHLHHLIHLLLDQGKTHLFNSQHKVHLQISKHFLETCRHLRYHRNLLLDQAAAAAAHVISNQGQGTPTDQQPLSGDLSSSPLSQESSTGSSSSSSSTCNQQSRQGTPTDQQLLSGDLSSSALSQVSSSAASSSTSNQQSTQGTPTDDQALHLHLPSSGSSQVSSGESATSRGSSAATTVVYRSHEVTPSTDRTVGYQYSSQDTSRVFKAPSSYTPPAHQLSIDPPISHTKIGHRCIDAIAEHITCYHCSRCKDPCNVTTSQIAVNLTVTEDNKLNGDTSHILRQAHNALQHAAIQNPVEEDNKVQHGSAELNRGDQIQEDQKQSLPSTSPEIPIQHEAVLNDSLNVDAQPSVPEANINMMLDPNEDILDQALELEELVETNGSNYLQHIIQTVSTCEQMTLASNNNLQQPSVTSDQGVPSNSEDIQAGNGDQQTVRESSGYSTIDMEEVTAFTKPPQPIEIPVDSPDHISQVIAQPLRNVMIFLAIYTLCQSSEI